MVEEGSRQVDDALLTAAKRGDWRAADALMDRIYDKPEQPPVARVPPDPAVEMIRSLRSWSFSVVCERANPPTQRRCLRSSNRLRQPGRSHRRERG
jgi:hypothetical protein